MRRSVNRVENYSRNYSSPPDNGCCRRLAPCPEAVRLWELVAAAHSSWTRARRFGRTTLQASFYERYRQGVAAYEAHFTAAPAVQEALSL